MDSREAPAPPPSSMMMGTIPQPQSNSYTVSKTTTNTSTMITPNSTSMQDAGFPFSSAQPIDSLNYGDRTSSAGGFSFDDGSKKKRGRPRKYSPDGSIALGLAPNPINSISNVALGDSSGGTPSSEPPSKRGRGRPPGSVKKQLDALGAPGVMFTPHVITVKAGEDIASKIMAFSQQGPRTVCILSANGAISNVTLRQPATSGGTVTYEGRFEIISLTGSFLLLENNGNRSRTGGLSVSLAGSDGRVLGGGVAGMLTAAAPVQVIVGSFIADGKKSKLGPSVAPLHNMLNFGGPVVGASPSSPGASSESSEENGSPLNHDAGIYSNVSQPIQNLPMYTSMAWANSTVKMLPN